MFPDLLQEKSTNSVWFNLFESVFTFYLKKIEKNQQYHRSSSNPFTVSCSHTFRFFLFLFLFFLVTIIIIIALIFLFLLIIWALALILIILIHCIFSRLICVFLWFFCFLLLRILAYFLQVGFQFFYFQFFLIDHLFILNFRYFCYEALSF